MEKYIQVEMATNLSTAYENRAEIKEAVDNAALGLYGKYGVQILDVQAVHGKVLLRMQIPDEIAENFSIGNHLRGVAAYLMKKYQGKFGNLVVGKRLLQYIEVPAPAEKPDGIPQRSKLAAISRFCELLQKEAEVENQEKIRKIMEILFEEEP